MVLNIDGIELAEGSLKGQSFDLIVYGQGFGVDQVSYDIAKQTGVAEKPAYQFRIVDAAGSILPDEGNQIKIVLTNRMEVNFILATGLSDGTYDLELALIDPMHPSRYFKKRHSRRRAVDMPVDVGLTADTGLQTVDSSTG